MQDDSYKKLAEDLLAYVTKDAFPFIQRYQQLTGNSGLVGRVESSQPAKEPPRVIEKPSKEIPGTPSAQSFSVSGLIRRADAIHNEHEAVDPTESQPYHGKGNEEEEAPF